MNKLFVDTLFVVALVNQKDQFHGQAKTAADQFAGYPLITTDAVLLEIGNALSRNYKSEAVDIIERFLSAEDIEIVHLTPDLFAQAFDLYKDYIDKSWGLTDCVSFVVMKGAGITSALTFDRHFLQAGFQVLMREDTA